jgi:hypothetical protein
MTETPPAKRPTYRQLSAAVDLSILGKVPAKQRGAEVRILKELGLLDIELESGAGYGAGPVYVVKLTERANDLLAKTRQ